MSSAVSVRDSTESVARIRSARRMTGGTMGLPEAADRTKLPVSSSNLSAPILAMSSTPARKSTSVATASRLRWSLLSMVCPQASGHVSAIAPGKA